MKPGVVEFDREKPLTVVEAVSRAGGATPLGKTQSIRIVRKNQKNPIPFDMKAYLRNSDKVPVILLEEDDVIEVPETIW